MNPNNPLEALRPLHIPEADFTWPLALGWWVLIALALAGLCGLIWWSLRRYRINAKRRSALRRLKQIESEWQSVEHSVQACEAINATIKATALHYCGQQPAALSGSAWQAWLHSRLKPKLKSQVSLEYTLTLYSGNNALLWQTREQTLSDARRWLQTFKGAAP